MEVRSQCHTQKERIGEDRQKMATTMMSFVNLSQSRITWEESQQGTAYQAGLWACLWDCPDHSGGCGKTHVSTIPRCWVLDRTKQRKRGMPKFLSMFSTVGETGPDASRSYLDLPTVKDWDDKLNKLFLPLSCSC